MSDHAISVGRLLLSAPFVIGGWHALRDPGALPQAASAIGLPRPELLTGIAAVAMLAGGIGVASGFAPVVGGAVLVASLAGTTAVVHSFWRYPDPTAQAAHRQAFVANCGLFGAVLVATVQAKLLQERSSATTQN